MRMSQSVCDGDFKFMTKAGVLGVSGDHGPGRTRMLMVVVLLGMTVLFRVLS